jgi:hypothetical protein
MTSPRDATGAVGVGPLQLTAVMDRPPRTRHGAPKDH